MELTFDAAKLTEASMLRVHELQEGYQSIISKVGFSKPLTINDGGIVAEGVHLCANDQTADRQASQRGCSAL